ncbi:dead/deah box helicase [Lucifera butyrica]|uniref:DNA helicase RecQ n=1 Tax=Lucifera butyrica TaxID=1351585 RepID=A0A498RFW3_9FIRM|nr:DNA helicase RecQ [Lucifera butyrica]VBB09700.1 dead/deah box helicase [Lucifera butyrica]
MLEKARSLLQKYYGYADFRPGQGQIITSLLEGRDTLAVMPTGAGKSLCFQLPALLLPGITVVISPLISLMKDQVDALHSVGIPAAFINSSLTMAEVRERLNAARRNQYKLLYIAPERLASEPFQAAFKEMQVSLVAIDEAHCVSQWGHDFRPSYRAVGPFIAALPDRPVIGAFTATATENVKQDIIGLMELANPAVYVTGFDRPNLSFAVIRGENKQNFIRQYVSANRNRSGIIYAATRNEVDNLYAALRKNGYSAGKYHAGLPDEERRQNQEAFIQDDCEIMVATNAFGMGIDKSNVRYVIHYNMPKNMEAYYQEAGRAGRDGEPSECILLFGAQDTMLQKFLIEQTVTDPERKMSEFGKLQAMVDYCHTPQCLRRYILAYFGETAAADECGNCSNCKEDAELADITLEAQKVFSCVLRLKERYGATLIADVLKGAKNKRVLQGGFNTLSVYGIMQEYPLQEIKDLINRLIATEYLCLTESEYPVVKLTPNGVAVLKNQAQVWQKVPRRPQRTADTNSLFEVLRALRKEIAAREQVPPYVVFADSTLKEMSEICPVDETALRSVTGVGDIKLKRYGAAFLKVIQEYTASHKLTPPPAASAPAAAVTKEKEIPSHEITLQLFCAGYEPAQIARQRNLKPVTVEDHLLRCSREGHSIDWSRLIPAREEALILDKIKELKTGRLKLLKDALPAEIDYATIKAVLCKHRQDVAGF